MSTAPASPACPPPVIAFYGDDFTGATDTLATLSRGGLRTVLFLRLPDAALLARAGPLDAIGIAGATRAMDSAAMATELLAVRRFVRDLSARIVHYKTCSTFDSAPHIGSIGTAVASLRPLSANPLVAIVGGQPNIDRYCVFGNLFAAVETGGTIQRIDRHETMSRHPVTPMAEADLRLHLASQGLTPVASVDYLAYDLAPAALAARVDRLVTAGAAAVLFDVGHHTHLPVIGRLLWERSATQPLLVVGASSVEQALIAHWQSASAATDHSLDGRAAPVPPPVGTPDTVPDPMPGSLPTRAQGPVLVVAGSLSGVTARQRTHATSYLNLRVDPQRLLDGGPADLAAIADTIVIPLSEGRHVLVHTSGADGSARPPRQTTARLSHRTGELLREVLAKISLRRVGIAGGDTSSHAVAALDVWGLSHLGTIAPGVALCRAHADSPALDGLELMLKGGQMGQPDIFERLLGQEAARQTEGGARPGS